MSILVELADDTRLRSPASSASEPPSKEEPTSASADSPPKLPRRTPPSHVQLPPSPQRTPGDSPPRPPPASSSSSPAALSATLISTSTSNSVSSSTPGELSLWCKLPAVINSGVLDRISNDHRQLQEAQFEVISSEKSYHNSLQLIKNHFQKPLLLMCQRSSPPEDPLQNPLSEPDYHDLFCNFDEVFKCSTAFLAELEHILQEDVLLSGLCEVIHKHATWNFYPYKQYCAQKIHQDRKLEQLTNQNAEFTELLSRVTTSPEVRGMALSAFLHLPVQRVQRFPLLMAAVLKRMEAGHPERDSCEEACQALTTLTQHCDEDAARELQRLETEAGADSSKEKTSKGRLSWRRRGIRRYSADSGVKRGS